MIDIKAIKAAAEAATPIDTDLLGDRYFGDSHSTATLTKAQDDFIATASPATVKTMCDEIERLREVLQHMLSSDSISSGERGLINQVLNGAKQ